MQGYKVFTLFLTEFRLPFHLHLNSSKIQEWNLKSKRVYIYTSLFSGAPVVDVDLNWLLES